jgi:hypothetical protein
MPVAQVTKFSVCRRCRKLASSLVMRNIACIVGLLTLSTGLAAPCAAQLDAAPAAPASSCGSSAQSLSPATPDEQTLVNYFEALNAKDYPRAWDFLGGDVQAIYGSEQRFADLMNDHIGCVRLLGVKPFGAHTYLVHLAAEYVTPFPAGSGALPEFWTVGDGTIVEFGTGP